MPDLITMSKFGRFGRFGNQIFEYMFLKTYAKKHGLEVQIPPWVGNYLFGTDDPPTTLVLNNVPAEESYDPGVLNYDTPYYWQVVCRNVTGETVGNVWSFTTIAAPEIIVDPLTISFGSVILS